jgi:hypothetical protein
VRSFATPDECFARSLADGRYIYYEEIVAVPGGGIQRVACTNCVASTGRRERLRR